MSAPALITTAARPATVAATRHPAAAVRRRSCRVLWTERTALSRAVGSSRRAARDGSTEARTVTATATAASTSEVVHAPSTGPQSAPARSARTGAATRATTCPAAMPAKEPITATNSACVRRNEAVTCAGAPRAASSPMCRRWLRTTTAKAAVTSRTVSASRPSPTSRAVESMASPCSRGRRPDCWARTRTRRPSGFPTRWAGPLAAARRRTTGGCPGPSPRPTPWPPSARPERANNRCPRSNRSETRADTANCPLPMETRWPVLVIPTAPARADDRTIVPS